MEQNMTLDVGFKGAINQNGVPIFNHDGAPLTVGGIIGSANTEIAYFGRVVSEDPSAPNSFMMGKPDAEHLVVGILQNDYAVRENDPAKADYLLAGFPASAITFGPLWLGSFTKEGSGTLTTPVRGCRVICKDDTGQIEFLAVGTAPPFGYTTVNASVKAYFPDTNKVLLFMGLSDAETQTPVTPTPVIPSVAKINSFSVGLTGVTGFTASGFIVESTGAIAITVPAATTVTALISQFNFEGASVKIGTTPQVSGVTTNDFTSPVAYVVTAADGTEKTYTVTVTVHS